ncbi:MAG: ribosome silencing factor [Alphaproteobacteria bacterium]
MPFNKRSIGVESVLNAVTRSLDDDKALDVVTIDLRGKSSIADYMVIASGRSHRHVHAIAEHLMTALKHLGLGRVAAEGLQQSDWVLLDAGDVIVHLFRPEIRSFYNLEKMWGHDAPAADLAGATA